MRAGIIACVLGAVAGLVTLIAQGPRDVSALAAQSHLGGLNLAPLARGFYKGALMVNGGYTRESAAAAIAGGTTDLVSFGATFLANPDLPERFRHAAAWSPNFN